MPADDRRHVASVDYLKRIGFGIQQTQHQRHKPVQMHVGKFVIQVFHRGRRRFGSRQRIPRLG